MASASSSSPHLGIRDEELLENQMRPAQQQNQQQQSSSRLPAPPSKKRRNQPGNPTDPDAEVIALSPKTLMATNRFVCEVCGKGFQREQNLQLHRRGHNLPWKLKLKSGKEAVRRRVYLCPEPSCVHHDPARALGDLTGIKKHFCRKHGEKKWKCDKCAKKYAVHSDLKAHAKTCGTREYRCDCGTLFSRRDSFITHRAFCDALSQDSSRQLPAAGISSFGSRLYGNHARALGLSQVNSQLGSLQTQNQSQSSQFDHLINPLSANPSASFRPPPPPPTFYLGNISNVQDFSGEQQQQQQQQPPPLLQSKPFHGLMQLPDLQGNANANLFNLGFGNEFNNVAGNGGGEPATLFSGNLVNDHLGGGMEASLYGTESSVFPRMSATALLQKAAQMCSTTSGTGPPLLRGFGGGDSLHVQMENEANQLQSLMNSLANGNSGGLFNPAGVFGGSAAATNGHRQALHENEGAGEFSAAFDGTGLGNVEENKFNLASTAAAAGGFRSSDRLTRDFLGVGSVVRSIGSGMSRRELSHGIDMSLFDPK